jgi:FdhD protein
MPDVRPVPVQRVDGAGRRAADDAVAVEEPLEIRVAGHRVSVTMRTPGHDAELAAGFLVTEGLLKPEALGVIGTCPGSDDNVVDVQLVEGTGFDPASLRRNFYATSSCGICGAAAIEQVRKRVPPVSGAWGVTRALLGELPARMRARQSVFERTGGLHAAGLFAPDGTLALLREDVGRHNAVDKAIGAMALRGALPLSERLLLVSGRASFEILQKAGVAGVPIVCAVSAPSSLAVEFARQTGMTLVGFLRGESFNVYAGEERILS